MIFSIIDRLCADYSFFNSDRVDLFSAWGLLIIALVYFDDFVSDLSLYLIDVVDLELITFYRFDLSMEY
jgi:hypothetical protein